MQNVLINRFVKHEQIFLHIFDNKFFKQYLLRSQLRKQCHGRLERNTYIFMMQCYDGDGSKRTNERMKYFALLCGKLFFSTPTKQLISDSRHSYNSLAWVCLLPSFKNLTTKCVEVYCYIIP